MALMVSDLLVVFDHMRHELTLMAYAFLDDEVGRRRRLRAGCGRDRRGCASASAARPARPARPRRETGPPASPAFTSNMSREQFEANVRRIIEYIHAGDAFQVVPSQRFSAQSPVEPFSIYRGLRTINPSPYMYFLDFGDFQLAGASPEPLVKVTGRRVETRPIAGTYPRGASEEEDRRQADELLRDPKERAEHVMLVDLGRNDLGRVCEYGSVQVDELMVVEAYSHVLHIVSQVSGRLRPEVTAMDALRAVLPAGTLSGAPKVRAMQIIDELEPHKRGSYGGAIGYLGFTGDLDTAIHIRTVVVKDGLVHVQAGGGTVADAKPDYEYRESLAEGEGGIPGRGAGREPAGVAVSMRVLVIDNYDSFTYNLVQYLGELGAEPGRGAKRQGHGRGAAGSPPRSAGDLAGPVHARRRRHLDRGGARPSPRRGSRRWASAWATSPWSRRSAGRTIRGEPIHGKDAEIEHDGEGVLRGLESPLRAGRYHSLVADPELARGARS